MAAAGRLLFIFVDGLGLGAADDATNPLARARTPALRGLLGGQPLAQGAAPAPGVVLAAADACLGVAGAPQSATGQTALLTGLNAALLEGRHVNAYPTALLKQALAARGLFGAVVAGGGAARYINAFRAESLRRVEAGTYRATAFTIAALAAGLRLPSIDDVRAGRALYHDITCFTLRAAGEDVAPLEPAAAGGRAARLAAAGGLTVFEYFLTDMVGHSGDMGGAVEVIETLDAFLGGALEAAAPAAVTVLLTSDHGNIEDTRTLGHTANPVPVLAVGPGADRFAGVRDITGVAPAAAELVGVPFPPRPASGAS